MGDVKMLSDEEIKQHGATAAALPNDLDAMWSNNFALRALATISHYKAIAEERQVQRATDCKSWEMRTAIAEQALAQAREGWKLVPAEPTPEMLTATLPITAESMSDADHKLAQQAVFMLSADDNPDGMSCALALISDWRRMIAAAPEAT